MRIYFIAVLLLLFASTALAQRECFSFEYLQEQLRRMPGLDTKISEMELEVQGGPAGAGTAGKPHAGVVYKIPVVVHILYNKPEENISDERIYSQIKVLNECFRRMNADTANTPEPFKSIAADCGIEFQLAISDPQRRATTGIVRKYTPVQRWSADDKMKFNAQAGSDAWDPKQYLNIWVCNMGRTAGYASFPGGPDELDGLVISYTAFGLSNTKGYEMGKTAVHETGHWLGLRHIWGDEYCGDDWVDDTPRQANFTPGCPSGIRLSCNNNPTGDMYMNFMDITQDACINLFTEGQKTRMRSFFKTGAARNKILSSVGLQPPLIYEIPAEEEPPKWLQPQMYPNPAVNELTLDLSYDIRWTGATIVINNVQGHQVATHIVSSKVVKINVGNLRPGLYILTAKRKDGETIKQKFIKM